MRLGAHQAKSWSPCLVTSPTALSQSSKKICMLMVWCALPLYGASPPALSFMFGGVYDLALLLTEYSLGLNVNSRVPAPSAACNFARTIFDIFSCFLLGKESVVGEFECLRGDLVGPNVERRSRPFHGEDALQVPGRDRVALRVERGDFRGLPFDLDLDLCDPVGDLLRVLVDGPGELDVLVLGAPGDPMNKGVLAALLVLEDVEFDGQAIAFRPVPKIAVTIDLDPESQALGVGKIRHRFLLSAGRSGSRRAPDRPAVHFSTGCGAGRRASSRAHPSPSQTPHGASPPPSCAPSSRLRR